MDKIIDGPFAETKEALLGLYVIDVADRDEAVDAARELKKANPTAVYEIRPIIVYLPGVELGKQFLQLFNFRKSKPIASYCPFSRSGAACGPMAFGFKTRIPNKSERKA